MDAAHNRPISKTEQDYVGRLSHDGSRAFDGFEEQASEMRRRLLSLTEATLANSFEFAHKVVQARGPQELIQIQGEFISRQAELIAEQSKRMGESAMQGAQKAGRMTSQRVEETSRRAAQAA